MANIVVYPYLSPRLVEVLAPDTEITIQELVNLIRDWEDDDRHMSMSFDSLISAAGKEDLGGGVSVGITATLQNAQVFFSPRSIPRDDGAGRTCDATDTGGRQLYVDDATFISDGVVRGDLVYNETTGSSATILEVVDENTINHLQLSGGSSVEWTSGDNYIVFEVEQCSISGGNLVAVDDVGSNISVALQTFGTQIIRTSSSSATLSETEELRDLTYGGQVFIDTIDGVGGTAFPLGNQSNAVDNVPDAVVINNRLVFNKYRIRGAITLDRTFDNTVFTSFGGHATENVDLGSQSVDNASFINLKIAGTQSGGMASFEGCLLDGISDFNGDGNNCALNGTIMLASASGAILDKCHSNVAGTSTPIIDFNNHAITTLQLRQYSGGVELRNMSNANNITSIDLVSGHVILDSSCTAGTIVVRGVGHLTDNSSGATVITDGLVTPGGLSTEQATYLKELWQLQGLDITNPMTVSSILRSVAGVLDLDLSESGGVITVQRQ